MKHEPMTQAAFKTEMDRQTELLTETISVAVRETMKTFKEPIANAAMSALVYHQALLLSSIKDSRARKALRKSAASHLSVCLASITTDDEKLANIEIREVRN